MTDAALTTAAAPAGRSPAERTVYAVILAVSVCHFLNDVMQSLLAALRAGELPGTG